MPDENPMGFVVIEEVYEVFKDENYPLLTNQQMLSSDQDLFYFKIKALLFQFFVFFLIKSKHFPRPPTAFFFEVIGFVQ